jgi:hypothetical protein
LLALLVDGGSPDGWRSRQLSRVCTFGSASSLLCIVTMPTQLPPAMTSAWTSPRLLLFCVIDAQIRCRIATLTGEFVRHEPGLESEQTNDLSTRDFHPYSAPSRDGRI